MKNYKYVTMMAASLILGLSSCSNDDAPGIVPDPETGEPTTINLSIAQPKTYTADLNATGGELAVNTIDVFIYNLAGNCLSIAKYTPPFTSGAVSNSYQLTGIPTTTGARNIFVGINLTADMIAAIEIGDPRAIPQTIISENPASMLHTSGSPAINSTNFVMFSHAVVSKNLVIPTDPSYATNNSIEVEVSRLLSKVVVNRGLNLMADPIDIVSPSGLSHLGKIQLLEFAVSNVNTRFFAVPDLLTFKDPNWTTPWTNLTEFKKPGAYLAINPASTAANNALARAIYTTENTSAGIEQDDHTYVSVRGQYIPDTLVTWTGSAIIKDPAIYNPGVDFHVVMVSGAKYFFQSLPNAQQYAAYENGRNTNSATLATYTQGYAYYRAFINPTPSATQGKKFDVLRNTIYTVSITKISGLGSNGDITGETNPIPEATDINIIVDVKPWDTISWGSDLQGV